MSSLLHHSVRAAAPCLLRRKCDVVKHEFNVRHCYYCNGMHIQTSVSITPSIVQLAAPSFQAFASSTLNQSTFLLFIVPVSSTNDLLDLIPAASCISVVCVHCLIEFERNPVLISMRSNAILRLALDAWRQPIDQYRKASKLFRNTVSAWNGGILTIERIRTPGCDPTIMMLPYPPWVRNEHIVCSGITRGHDMFQKSDWADCLNYREHHLVSIQTPKIHLLWRLCRKVRIAKLSKDPQEYGVGHRKNLAKVSCFSMKAPWLYPRILRLLAGVVHPWRIWTSDANIMKGLA